MCFLEIALETLAISRFVVRSGVMAVICKLLGVQSFGTIWVLGLLVQLIARAIYHTGSGSGILGPVIGFYWIPILIVEGLLGLVLWPVSYILNSVSRIDMKLLWAGLFIAINATTTLLSTRRILSEEELDQFFGKLPLRHRIQSWIVGN